VIAFYFEYLTREKYRSTPDGPVFVNGAVLHQTLKLLLLTLLKP
jgi:hypothetical protein